MTKPTLAEAQIDLTTIKVEIGCLYAIVDNLRTFQSMAQQGEDRSFVKLDIMRYQGLLDEAKALKTKMEAYIKSL